MMRRENSNMSLMSAGNDGLKINDLNDALEKFTRPNDNEEVIRLKKQFLKSFIKFITEFLDHIEYVNHIFNLFKKDPDDRTIKKRKILDQLKRMGILFDDPRITNLIQYFDNKCEEDIDVIQLTIATSGKGATTNPHISFLGRVMTSDLQISDFLSFTKEVHTLFK